MFCDVECFELVTAFECFCFSFLHCYIAMFFSCLYGAFSVDAVRLPGN